MAAKKLSFETKLADNMAFLPQGKWYSIAGRKDYDRFVQCVKDWIDCGEPYEFNSDYSQFRICRSDFTIETYFFQDLAVLPPGLTKEHIAKGYVEQVLIKGHSHNITHESASYRIYKGDQLIAIEHERKKPN